MHAAAGPGVRVGGIRSRNGASFASASAARPAIVGASTRSRATRQSAARRAPASRSRNCRRASPRRPLGARPGPRRARPPAGPTGSPRAGAAAGPQRRQPGHDALEVRAQATRDGGWLPRRRLGTPGHGRHAPRRAATRRTSSTSASQNSTSTGRRRVPLLPPTGRRSGRCRGTPPQRHALRGPCRHAIEGRAHHPHQVPPLRRHR